MPARPTGTSSRRPTSSRCFAANKDITVDDVDPLGNHGILRFNHMQPPFNNLKMRQAVLYLVDQKDYMGAASPATRRYWKTCVVAVRLRHAVRDRCRRRAC